MIYRRDFLWIVGLTITCAVMLATQAFPTEPAGRMAPVNESQWIVEQTARDILEMCVFAQRHALPGPETLSLTGAGEDPVLEVHLEKGAPLTVRFSPQPHIWSPLAYEPLARLLLDQMKLAPPGSLAGGEAAALGALTDLRAAVIERESRRVSADLRRDMLDPRAHEEAALVLAALGLREASGEFSDIRSTLSRMAAHLALARALRKASPQGSAGTYAEIALLTLAGRERESLDALSALTSRAGKTRTEAAWNNVLRMRNTRDWRVLKDAAAATLLERLEHFRALAESLGGLHALDFLTGHAAEPVPDWGRIALENSFTVEEGNTFTPGALALELHELAEIWGTYHDGAELKAAALKEALSARPGRCLGLRADGRPEPRVIDWGSWSRFFQRHAFHVAARTSYHLGYMAGLKDDATNHDRAADRLLEGLDLYPLLVATRNAIVAEKRAAKAATTGPPEDDASCTQVSALVRNRPELVSAVHWHRLEQHCPRARASGTLPPLSRWFSSGLPPGTAYDTSARLGTTLASLYTPSRLEALKDLAPFDLSVLAEYYRQYKSQDRGPLNALYMVVGEYNLSVMKWQADLERGDLAKYRRRYDGICKLDPDTCMTLGDNLADRGLEDEAAAAYQRAVDHARDRVSVANGCEWLVLYYFERGDSEKALAVAQMAAEVFSHRGLQTLAGLLERMGRYDEAEGYYKKIAERYDDRVSLAEFYVRHERKVGDGRYRVQAAAALTEVFPQGLQHVALADLSGPPPDGARIRDDSPQLPQMGLSPGDVVVALDGYRVHSYQQYRCVRSFTDDPSLVLIAWHQGRYVESRGRFKNRRFGVTFETYAVPR